jgi:hypothetical protein
MNYSIDLLDSLPVIASNQKTSTGPIANVIPSNNFSIDELDALPIINNQPIEKLDKLDASRFTERKSEFIGNALKNAGKEVKDFAKSIYSIASSPETKDIFLENMLLPINRRKKTLEFANTLGKSSPEILKDLALSTAESFGFKPKEGFSLDTALNKLENKPLESVFDLSILYGIGEKVAKKGASSISSEVSKNLLKEKKVTKEILSKSELVKKESDFLDKLDVITPVQDLIKNSDSIKYVSRKQLDNPNYAKELGRRFQLKLKALEDSEKISLNRELKKIGNVEINNKEVLDNLRSSLDNNDLLLSTSSSRKLSEIIDPEINKTSLKRVVESLESGEKFTVSKLKDKMDIIDQRINYNSLKPDQEGLHILRTELRSTLGNIAEKNNTNYNDIASKVHERLKAIGKKSKKITETGGGEKFGSKFSITSDEVTEIKKILGNSNSKVSGALIADIDKLDGWHRWNVYFNQNGSVPFVPAFISRGGIPIPTIDPLKSASKIYRKSQIRGFGLDVPLKLTKESIKSVPAGVKLSNTSNKQD